MGNGAKDTKLNSAIITGRRGGGARTSFFLSSCSRLHGSLFFVALTNLSGWVHSAFASKPPRQTRASELAASSAHLCRNGGRDGRGGAHFERGRQNRGGQQQTHLQQPLRRRAGLEWHPLRSRGGIASPATPATLAAISRPRSQCRDSVGRLVYATSRPSRRPLPSRRAGTASLLRRAPRGRRPPTPLMA